MDEKTGIEMASLAGRILDGGPYTEAEVRSLAASALTQAPNKGEAQGLPVAGYKATQPDWAVEAVNGLKHAEERTLRLLDNLGGAAIDHRFLAIGRTQIQQGFMAAARAIFQPQRISNLPEDVAQPALFGDDMQHAGEDDVS